MKGAVIMKGKIIFKTNTLIIILISLFISLKPLPAKTPKCLDALSKCVSQEALAEYGMLYCAIGYVWCVTFIGK